MTREEYQLWAEHPQTKQFHQFLIDYRNMIMEKWVNGSINGDAALSERASAQFAFLLTNLSDDAISEFYQNKEAV
ncbi:MAG: hypothetical protein WCD86_11095 [Ktedonobacteraceae bacterium]